MASKNGTIAITISGDAGPFKRSIGDAEQSAQGFLGKVEVGMGKMKSVFAGIGMSIGQNLAQLPGMAVGFMSDALGMASDLGETLSKNQTIFGESAQALVEWAENAPRALGMTQEAALNATGTLGNMFTQLGITAEQARGMSQANVQLAADFASFHNADTVSVMDAMSAAYRGEYDSVQRFVPLINAEKVERKAMEMTLKTSTQLLTEQDKALAVNALLMEGAGAAVGDFARTSDSAANQSKTLSATFAQMQTDLGQALMPALIAVQGFILNTAIPAFQAFTGFLGEHKEILIGAAVALGTGLVGALIVAIPMVWAFAAGVIAATWPVLAIAVAIGALTAGVIWAWNNIDGFRGAILAFLDGVKWVWNWITNNWQTLLAVLTGPIGVAVLLITAHWETIKSGVQGVYNAIVQWWGTAIDFLWGIPGKILEAVGDLSGLLWDAGASVISGLIDGIKSMVPDLTGALGAITDLIPFEKGPIEKDRVLLIPSGRAVMEGFTDGLMMGWEDSSRPMLQATTRALPEAAGTGGVRASGSAGKGPEIHLHFNSTVPANKRDIGRMMDAALREYRRAAS